MSTKAEQRDMIAAILRKPKNKRSFDDKRLLITDKLTSDSAARIIRLGSAHYGRYSMAQIAKMCGYSRSNRFLEDLKQMAENGDLIAIKQGLSVSGYEQIGKGICNYNIYFAIPEHHNAYIDLSENMISRMAKKMGL